MYVPGLLIGEREIDSNSSDACIKLTVIARARCYAWRMDQSQLAGRAESDGSPDWAAAHVPASLYKKLQERSPAVCDQCALFIR